MKPQTVVKYFQGISATARAFGIRKQSVYDWLDRGVVPPLRQIQAEELSKGKLRARRNVYAIPSERTAT